MATTLGLADTLKIGATYRFNYQGSTHQRVVYINDCFDSYCKGWDSSANGWEGGNRSFKYAKMSEVVQLDTHDTP